MHSTSPVSGSVRFSPPPRRDIGQPALPQGKLHLVPILCSKERLCDEKPKAHEELRVDDFVTPRGTAGVALHLNPNKLAQYSTGGFIAAVAGFDETAPKLGIARKKGASCIIMPPRLPAQG